MQESYPYLEQRIAMINPFSFFDIIKHETSIGLRAEMANLALHLYYDGQQFPFQVSRLENMPPTSTVICMGAISWILSNRKKNAKKFSYKISRIEIITEKRKIWLELILSGQDPNSNQNFIF